MAVSDAKLVVEKEPHPRFTRQAPDSAGEAVIQKPVVPSAMLGVLRKPRHNARGSAAVREGAMLALQRSHGNHATLRSVQRDIWDLFKGGSVGDWQIKPPTWSGETDDRYDHPENQRRAEQKEADERGYSPTPEEWWKPKTFDPKAPLPWMPKIKEQEPVEPIIIPPKPPDEKGDYPIPPWPDEEVYA
jgi:hypothetical protein